MQYWHYEPKSTLSMGRQNPKSIYQHGTILVEFDDHVKTIKGD